jgi:thiamine kinase-like enzyme
MQQIIEILRHIPPLTDLDPGGLKIERLSGLLNANYKLTGPEMCVVVHLAAPGTEAYVNHETEARNARAAAAAGVAPEVIYSDGRHGIIVTRFVEGAVPLDAERAGSAPYLARIGRKLRDLHTRSRPFANTFNPFHQLDRYVAIMESLGRKPPPAFVAALAGLNAVRDVVDARAAAFAPCHCDPLPENILDDGHRLFIIDYEFSGNCDPLFDLGDFSGEANLDGSQDTALLESYFDGAVPANARALLIAYKAVSLLVSAGWAQVQVASRNARQDFEAYGDLRLQRCQDVLAASELPHLIGDLAAKSVSPASRAQGDLYREPGRRRDESEAPI